MKLFIRLIYSSSVEGDDEVEELVLLAQRGDVEAYTNLILEIKNDLYKICKARLYNNDDIDDAIQETMIQSYKQIKKLRDVSKFKHWIIKILINNCNKIYRQKKKYTTIDEDYNIEKIKLESNIEKMESDVNFYTLIKDLKYEERIIIILYYMKDFTLKEISNILNININTVKTRLYRAKEKIKYMYNGGVKIG